MKQILTIIFCSILLNVAKSQTILPLQTDEYCPGVEYTFTATITKPYSSMIGEGGCFVTQLPTPPVGTTFTFKGKFADANQNQRFRIYHPDNTSTPFDFKKIKSLFYGTSCTPIQPNQTSITSPPCQVNNHTISFNNIQWGTAFETPQLCFGTITTYEYLLPSGWSIGANFSNGSTWIAEGNNVTVTSDLSTGNGMVIRVRPANNCSSGLANGQIPATIFISRPKPLLTFTGGYTVCTSLNFEANNIPSWVSNYTWLVTPNTVFDNGNPTSNPTTVNKLANGEGDIQLTISSPSCPLAFVYNTQEITNKPKLVAGTPQVSNSNPLMMIYSGPGDENAVCRYQGTTFDLTYTANSTINWSAISHQGVPWPSWSPTYEGDIYVEFFKPTQNTLVLQMDASNTCGTISYQFGFIAVDCGGFRSAAPKNSFKVSPNPANNIINIAPVDKIGEKSESRLITDIDVTDFNNNLLSRKKFDNVKTAQLYIGNLKTGTYYLTIVSGKNRETQTILKQ